MTINMQEIIIYIKSAFVLSLCWLTEFAIINFTNLSIIGPDIKEFLIECKEVINVLVSLLVLLLTIIKIRNERKKLEVLPASKDVKEIAKKEFSEEKKN